MIHTLVNHLWQSTLFVVAAGFLTLLLRKNGAHTRYWLWFAASCKFLIPFSLLISLGSNLSWRPASSAPASVPLIFGHLARPFSAAAATGSVASTTPILAAGVDWRLVLMGIWACGAVGVALYWVVRWLRIKNAVGRAKPLALDAAIPVKLSSTNIEPGIVGIFRPVLLLPKGIREHLSLHQLQMLLDHEICHVRRHDNLTAAIHMLVEAVFWFYPPVWWLGRRLILERENACDEAVITAGGDRQAYSEGLLAVCKFYLESPLDCAAGVAGAELKRRIERIMTLRATHKLSGVKKALLATAAAAAILVPVMIGAAFVTTSRVEAQTGGLKGASFQNVTIRASQPGNHGLMINVSPNGFRVRGYSLRDLIAFAFHVQGAMISGPKILDAGYNIEAKPPGTFAGSGYQMIDEARAMVRKMLMDRFDLKVHRSTQSLSVFVLTGSGSGPDFRQAGPDELGPEMHFGTASISGTALSMDDFLELLSKRLPHPVLDKTGLTKTYDFKLSWQENSSATAGETQETPAKVPNPSPEVLAKALKSQLGLTLQLQRRPVEVLVVDHAQSPRGLLAARKAVPMAPPLFDKYVGHYEFPGDWIMNVYRKNDHFWTQLQGQPPVEVFPEGHGEFFAKVVDAQISFELDAQGHVSGLVLHQNGQNVHAPRINDAKAKEMADALQARIKRDAPTRGSEQAVHQLIQGLATGRPDYNQMGKGLAAVTRKELPTLHKVVASLGPLVSLKFTGVNQQGWDTYKAQFKHGSEKWSINLGPDGKVVGALFRPSRN